MTAPREGNAQVWQVGKLLHAIAESLESRFNPVSVQGELSGFSQASSGHCYFSLKDAQGQVRCAMFRRAAALLDFSPKDGQLVELRGRLGVYEPRGELQLVVESLRQAGQGSLFDEFLRRKAKLQEAGLFEADRKKPLPAMPRAIGVVTSLGAAALHDVVSALQRRVPHLPVVIYPASVQGAQSATELRNALQTAYARRGTDQVDVLLLVRGGGAMEDLWSFNDESLARTIADSPIAVVCGVGHETDFTIADFCADLRAPTPTAAAELCAQPQQIWLSGLDLLESKMRIALDRHIEQHSQRLDRATARISQPSHLVTRQHARLVSFAQRLNHGVNVGIAFQQSRLKVVSQSLKHGSRAGLLRQQVRQAAISQTLPRSASSDLRQRKNDLQQLGSRLSSIDPALVLQRGYALLTDTEDRPVTSAAHTRVGQALRATLADGQVDLAVTAPRLI